MWQIIVVLAAALISYFVPTPQEMRNAFIAGQNFYASRDYKRALAQYDLILNTESAMLSEDSVRVSLLNNEYYVSVRIASAYQKANALKQLQNIDSAISIFRLVANNPAEPKLAALAQFQIYDILYQNKRFEESIKEAYRLSHKFPEDKKAEQSLYDIGWAYRELNNLDSSSYFFELLIEKYPNTEYYARALYQ
ncbi:MAG: tetratricopeptide repeat protein, partial [Ignavibacteria bacterium]|nr:tetratricopeptide repeat protein [Ignavibacteria bacterium]